MPHLSLYPHHLVQCLAHSRYSVNAFEMMWQMHLIQICDLLVPTYLITSTWWNRRRGSLGANGTEVKWDRIMGCYLSVRSNRIQFADGIKGSTSFVLRMRSFSLCFRVWPKDPNSLFHHEIQIVVCVASLKHTLLAVHLKLCGWVTGLTLETPTMGVWVVSWKYLGVLPGSCPVYSEPSKKLLQAVVGKKAAYQENC